ncbi:hypothetical protein, partial [Geothermobacter hydrogeniphilus]|uniref:hypothetical protein n=1 Tax=Geothermobacter hydrogeniphilus TaxID=1969733 RepID=UPI001E425CAA
EKPTGFEPSNACKSPYITSLASCRNLIISTDSADEPNIFKIAEIKVTRLRRRQSPSLPHFSACHQPPAAVPPFSFRPGLILSLVNYLS